MPDGGVLAFDSNEVCEFTITVGCECYSSLELVGHALAQLPDFNGNLAWDAPCTPDPAKGVSDAELVLIVSDQASLQMAIDRWSTYKKLKQASILIYLQGDEDVSAEEIPGLILPRSQLAAGFSTLTKALFTPVIPQGLICIDWADTRHILVMDGQMVMEEATGSELETVIDAAVTRLRKRASGRSIQGLQASILCSPNKLAMRHVHRLNSACKLVTNEEAILIIGAPFLDWPDADYYEVRIAARIACLPGLDTLS